MYHHNHIQHSGTRPGPRVTNRVPQFNKDYCGYHCGEGCEPYDVEGTESDTSSTLVTENGEDALRLSTPAHAHSEASLLPLSCTVHDEGLEQEGEHLPRNNSMNSRDGSFASPQFSNHYDDSFEGARNFISSGTHSARTFGSQSVGTVSPSAWVLETGGWVDGGDHRLPPEYYFLETPLRLSPDERSEGRLDSS